MKSIALLSVLVIAAWSVQAADKGYGDISHADLKAAMASKSVTLLDCNGSASYARGHIPGALDFNAIKSSLADRLPKDKDALIVSYCGGPRCGAYKKGAAAAEELGYKNVKHYSGGLSGWKKAGENFEAPSVNAVKTKAACSSCSGCGK